MMCKNMIDQGTHYICGLDKHIIVEDCDPGICRMYIYIHRRLIHICVSNTNATCIQDIKGRTIYVGTNQTYDDVIRQCGLDNADIKTTSSLTQIANTIYDTEDIIPRGVIAMCLYTQTNEERDTADKLLLKLQEETK